MLWRWLGLTKRLDRPLQERKGSQERKREVKKKKNQGKLYCFYGDKMAQYLFQTMCIWSNYFLEYKIELKVHIHYISQP